GLSRIGHRELTSTRHYNYPSNGGEGVRVYLLDTGINQNHYDFEDRVSVGPMLAKESRWGDIDNHGTPVAGIIAGAKYGIAKKAQIISIQVLGDKNTGDTETIIEALNWVSEEQQKHPGMSWAQKRGRRSVKANCGVCNSMSLAIPTSHLVDMTIERLAQQNITIVAAAGNGDPYGKSLDACIGSPASARLSITVGSSDSTDKAVSYSNYGRCVTLFAPGIDIISTSAENRTGYCIKSGTSMAAPFVTGVAANILGQYGPLPPQKLREIIIQLATPGVIKNIHDPDTPNRLLYASMAQEVPTAEGAITAATLPFFGNAAIAVIVAVFSQSFI
ncbi:peptidase S8/S53 domain-containing protein, partial [Thamnocephalis sphaerospora]